MSVLLFFPVLNKFSLRLVNPWGRTPVPLTARWMTTWAHAINRATSISTAGDESLGSRFLKELVRTRIPWFHNLTEVSLTCEAEDGIKFLTGFTKPLKKLTLAIPLESRNLPDFENLLKKFASSLELLSFQISTEGLEPKSRFVLNLPCLPNLKSLNVHFGEFECARYYQGCGSCFVKDVARLRLAFGDDVVGIKYERHLPAIRFIVIHPKVVHDAANFWNTYSDLLESFLPKEDGGQGCITLRHFELPVFYDVKIETHYRQAHRLPEVFPNVRNKWMDRLREVRNK